MNRIFLLLCVFFLTPVSNSSNFDIDVVENNQEHIGWENGIVNAELLSKEEREKELEIKMRVLKAQKKEFEADLKKVKELRDAYVLKLESGDAEHSDLLEKAEILRNEIKIKKELRDKETKNLRISQSLNNLGSNSELIQVKTKNGKEITLIKYTVFSGDSFSKIVSKTFKEKESATNDEIIKRLRIIIKLNKKIKNIESIHPGDIVYIPVFR